MFRDVVSWFGSLKENFNLSIRYDGLKGSKHYVTVLKGRYEFIGNSFQQVSLPLRHLTFFLWPSTGHCKATGPKKDSNANNTTDTKNRRTKGQSLPKITSKITCRPAAVFRGITSSCHQLFPWSSLSFRGFSSILFTLFFRPKNHWQTSRKNKINTFASANWSLVKHKDKVTKATYCVATFIIH